MALLPGIVLAVPMPVLAADGAQLYAQSCLACHGADGTGVMPGVRDLTASDGPLNETDEVLFRSIRDGVQSGGDGAVPMPARGGNPALTESDIYILIDYLRQTFGSAENSAQYTPGEKP